MTTKFTLKRGRCDPDDPYGATLTRISFSFKLRFSISIFHNTPCFPQNISISIVLSFSWDHCNSQEKVKPFFFFIFKGGGGWGGGNKVYHGRWGNDGLSDVKQTNGSICVSVPRAIKRILKIKEQPVFVYQKWPNRRPLSNKRLISDKRPLYAFKFLLDAGGLCASWKCYFSHIYYILILLVTFIRSI